MHIDMKKELYLNFSLCQSIKVDAAHTQVIRVIYIKRSVPTGWYVGEGQTTV